ncbi:hypothetical protein STRAU_7440 [Streptomyces aurantiacus JA 4570]|uniref:Uncharacterized protein n=1 Tax=Streptomyces aurantiacus JA 4570 TaxID=1286094 RepID=S3ZAB3_9ACTN|nr:hypothetical protein STRAU_7440 [Streptomyces aurantiacus JA 4570]
MVLRILWGGFSGWRAAAHQSMGPARRFPGGVRMTVRPLHMRVRPWTVTPHGVARWSRKS